MLYFGFNIWNILNNYDLSLPNLANGDNWTERTFFGHDSYNLFCEPNYFKCFTLQINEGMYTGTRHCWEYILDFDLKAISSDVGLLEVGKCK